MITLENKAEINSEINMATESNTYKSYVSEDKVNLRKWKKLLFSDEHGVDTLIYLGLKVNEKFRQILIRRLTKTQTNLTEIF